MPVLTLSQVFEPFCYTENRHDEGPEWAARSRLIARLDSISGANLAAAAPMAPMASANSPVCGHPKIPQARTAEL